MKKPKYVMGQALYSYDGGRTWTTRRRLLKAVTSMKVTSVDYENGVITLDTHVKGKP